ncbi:MAG: DUF433 domain-containing protein [bacterium]|nr:DUF433 domain-containing protein [bacterium]
MKEIIPGITIDPNVRFGKPIVQGTRVPVDLVIKELGAGMTIEEVKREYDLTEKQIGAVLRYAAELVAREELAFI